MVSISEKLNLKPQLSGADIKSLYEAENNTNAYTTEEKNKLAGIEAGATADQTANEILTAIKTVDGIGSGLDADTVDGLEATAFATAAQGSKADVLYYQPTTTKTTTYSAISGEEVRCDTTGGAFTVSLPVTGRVRIIDVGGTGDTTGFGQHNLTLTPQPGDTIAGETDLVLDVGLTSITLVYISGNWVVTDLNGAAFTTIDWGDITNKPSLVETTGDQTISGTKTFSTALILPNNSRINGVEHFYQTTKPITRGDGSALVAGDIWYKPVDNGLAGTAGHWIWTGSDWVSSEKYLLQLGCENASATTSFGIVPFRVPDSLGSILVSLSYSVQIATANDSNYWGFSFVGYKYPYSSGGTAGGAFGVFAGLGAGDPRLEFKTSGTTNGSISLDFVINNRSYNGISLVATKTGSPSNTSTCIFKLIFRDIHP